MGRPRKRATVDIANENAPQPRPLVTSASEQDDADCCPPRTTNQEDPGVPAMVDYIASVDIDLDTLEPGSLIDPDIANVDMDFLQFVGPDFISTQPFEPTEQLPPPSGPLVRPWDHEIWKMDIDFTPSFPDPTPLPPDSNSSNGRSTILPSLFTTNSSSQETPTPSHLSENTTLQPSTCSCLASLYLSLDALARLPTTLHPAIHVARGASKAAHDSMQCRLCCAPPHEPMRLSSFQNMMVLGALLPSIADAYHQILALVDAETGRAVTGGGEHVRDGLLPFSLSGFGGLWGSDSARQGGCPHGASYEGRMLPPAEWRLTVRALLKVDVYGLNNRELEGGGGFHQLGLRDLVARMDERSRARHADIDALIDAGVPPPRGLGVMRAAHTVEGREPPCRRIIAMAREAVESLVIA